MNPASNNFVPRDLPPVRSMLDVGCGRGSWLPVWQQLGVDDVVGIDGHYLDPASLVIDRQNFLAAELSQSANPRLFGRSIGSR